MPDKIGRAAYAAMYGPTVGDRVRLADTALFVEVEKDFTTYGEEVKFGGGKVIRDGMGQAQASRAEGAVDTVITNALIVDHWGIVKADIEKALSMPAPAAAPAAAAAPAPAAPSSEPQPFEPEFEFEFVPRILHVSHCAVRSSDHGSFRV